MSQEKVKGSTASNVELVFGILFALGGLGSLSQGFYWSSGRIWAVLGTLFLGVFLILKAIEWKQLIKLYRTYSTLLANDPSGSIANLASSTSTTVEKVRNNLRLMIKRGLAANLVIDEAADRVLISSGVRNTPQSQTQSSPAATQQATHASAAGNVVVQCPHCGASNSLPPHSTAKCGHCGGDIASA